MGKLQYTVHVLLFTILSTTVLYFGRNFLVPTALAAVLAMLFIEVSNRLERLGLSRALSSLASVLLFLITIAIILGLLSWQLNNFTENLHGMKERLLTLLQRLRDWLNETVGISNEQQKNIVEKQGETAGGSSSNLLANFASAILDILVNAVLVLVYMFLFLFYRSRIKKFILKLVPSAHDEQAETIIHQSAKVSRQYLSGLTAMIGMLWVLYGIGFSIVGVQSALFFAILCGVLEIVPFVGNITGTSLTVLAVIAQGGQSQQILGVVAVYLVVQFFQTYILEPLVVGNQVNINPLFTIMALVAGEAVWGIAGMILAIPMLGIIKIICDHIPTLAPYGFLIGTEAKRKRALQLRRKKT